MDINTLRGLATVFAMIAFLGVCWWAFSGKRKQRFDEAAQLPFADEDEGEPGGSDKARNKDENEER